MKSYIACIQKINEVVCNEINSNSGNPLPHSQVSIFEAKDFNLQTELNSSNKDFSKNEDFTFQFNSICLADASYNIDENEKVIKECLDKDIKSIINAGNCKEKLQEFDELVLKYEEISGEYRADNSGKKNKEINQKLTVLAKQIALQLSRWKLNSLKGILETTMKENNHITNHDLVLNKLNEIKRTIVNSEIGKYCWNSLEIEQNEVDDLVNKAKQHLIGFNESILEPDYEEDLINKIKLEYCIVDVNNKLISSAKYSKPVVLVKNLNVAYKKDIKIILKAELEKAKHCVK